LPAEYQSPEAEALFRGSYEAEEKVTSLPSIHGGTVGERLDQKASSPAVEDMGWITRPSDGGFHVQRMLLMGDLVMKYNWEVDRHGAVRAINGKALGITK
jgi:hypothetical protein